MARYSGGGGVDQAARDAAAAAQSTADAAYVLPGTGIPKTDMAAAVGSSLDSADSAYQKPGTGIPSSDMATAVQTSLGDADSAYQLPVGGIPKDDLAAAVGSSLDAADAAEPALGNPSADNDVLKSSIAGARAWTTPSTGDVSEAELNAARDNDGISLLRLLKASSLGGVNMLDGCADGFTNAGRVGTATNAILSGGVYRNDFLAKALLHFNGDDASTTFTDEQGNTWTAVNQAQLDTAQQKFGTAGLLLDGTGDAIYTAKSADLNLTNQNFCLEAWVYLAEAHGGYNCIAQSCGGVDSWSDTAGYQWAFSIYFDATLYFSYRKAGAAVNIGSSSPISVAFGWHHLAAVNSGGTVTLYVDGVSVGSGTLTGGTIDESTTGTQRIYIGDDVASEEHGFNGWIDEFRMVVGEPVYTENFTPDTEEFVGSGNVTLISAAATAEAVPTNARLLVVGVVDGTLNTDLLGWVSRDGGSTWTQVTLVDEGAYDGAENIYAGSVDISAQPSGSSMKWKVTSANSAIAQVAGAQLLWW